MSTNEQEFIVEDGMPAHVMERIKGIQEEGKGVDNVKIVENTETAPPEEQAEINLDAPVEEPKDEPKEEPKADGETTDSTDETVHEINVENFEAFAKEQGMEADAFKDKLLRDTSFKVKVRGKEKEYDYNTIKSILSREDSSQERYDKLRTSSTLKMGTLVEAAEKGDAAAQKKLRDLVVKFSGAEDADDMNDKLDGVEGEYDEGKAVEDAASEESFDIEFADVKDDVDYQTHLDTIQTTLKDLMPSKVYDHYWNTPSDRKGMYNLAASGRLEELASAFQEAFVELPHEKQMELEGDPEKYGRMFLNVIHKQNATKQKQVDPPEDDGLSSVSSGTRPKQRKSDSELPDFSKMSSAEFRAWQDKNGIQRYS